MEQLLTGDGHNGPFMNLLVLTKVYCLWSVDRCVLVRAEISSNVLWILLSTEQQCEIIQLPESLFQL